MSPAETSCSLHSPQPRFEGMLAPADQARHAFAEDRTLAKATAWLATEVAYLQGEDVAFGSFMVAGSALEAIERTALALFSRRSH